MRYFLTLVLALMLFSGCDLLSPNSLDVQLESEPKSISMDKIICTWTPQEVPTLIDGYPALHAKVHYPKTANKIEGRVIVTFTVTTEGMPIDAKVAKGLGPAFDAEALRVVKSARFTPVKKHGKVIASPMALPVMFKLPAKTDR